MRFCRAACPAFPTESILHMCFVARSPRHAFACGVASSICQARRAAASRREVEKQQQRMTSRTPTRSKPPLTMSCLRQCRMRQSPGAAPVSLQQHVSEYALAGSLDGLRTGLGQSIGGIVNLWVSAALQSTGHLSSLAFASAVCAFQEHQVLPASHSPCRPTRICLRVEWSLELLISYACIHALMHEYIRTDVHDRRDDGQNADRHHVAQAWKAVAALRRHKGCRAHASAS